MKISTLLMNEVNDKERDIMSEIMEFPNREEFREWLREHCVSNDGIWLLFGKAGGPKTYTRAYLDAKTDAGRDKRITWMVDRLNKSLKPICYVCLISVRDSYNLQFAKIFMQIIPLPVSP